MFILIYGKIYLKMVKSSLNVSLQHITKINLINPSSQNCPNFQPTYYFGGWWVDGNLVEPIEFNPNIILV